VDQVLDDPGPRQLLQMQAWLAQPDAHALNVPDPETPAHQLVKPHSPHNHLTARLRTGQPHVLERLGLDQRQCLARLCAILIEVPVAAEPFTCDRGNRRDGLQRVAWADIDLLDIHEPIMAEGAALAYPISGRFAFVSDDAEAIESTAHHLVAHIAGLVGCNHAGGVECCPALFGRGAASNRLVDTELELRRCLLGEVAACLLRARARARVLPGSDPLESMACMGGRA
jgi:hypothetical protein